MPIPSRRSFKLCAVLLATIGLITAVSGEEKALTNDDVIALAKAGLGDDVVVSKVQQAPKEALDVSTDALIALKKAGLSKPIIDAMIKRVAQRSAPPAASSEKSSTTVPTQKPKPPECRTKCCVDNYVKEGSFALGNTFKAFTDTATAQRSTAFERAAKAIASLGWQITSANKDAGLISGTTTIHQIIGGKAVQATLSVSITDGDYEGIHVEATMFAPSGTKLLDKEVQKDFCKIFESIEK